MADIRIIGGSESQQTSLVELFAAAGIVVVPTTMALIGDVLPDALVVTGSDAMDVLTGVREHLAWQGVPILACVPSFPQSASVQALAAGANEVLMLPAPPSVAGNRLRRLLPSHGNRSAQEAPSDGAGLDSALLRAVTESSDDPWPHILMRLCEVLEFDRASLVVHVAGSEFAYVVAVSDPQERKFALPLRDYPELADALHRGQDVWIRDVASDPRMERVRERLPAHRVGSIAVVPARHRGRVVGALVLRRRVPGAQAPVVHAGQLAWLAAVAATYLEYGPASQLWRDQSARLSQASYEAERRLHGIDSLRRHFEASSDGMVILDAEGRILYVNAAAEALTGIARDGLLGTQLEDLVVESQRALVPDTISRVLRNQNVTPFDLDVVTTGHHPVTVSVTTSTALSDRAAVVLSFRDVTLKRALERELESTKDFLERLINSTVDAIIVADLEGRIVLFNRGAELLLGYTSGEVVGRMNVDDFYPPGVGRQMMRMLRSTAHGGVGRLEPTRREVRTRAGEVIPISMTASLIYQDGSEVASVGILTDLRERIRMESKLLAAQAQLQQSEKQAIVAQLAGATAHELNQPLTAIFGYAELLRRQSAVPESARRAIDTILSEAERMAELVKKIGRLSRLETKAYVGSATIVDLERSSRLVALAPHESNAESSGGGEVMDAFDEELRTQEFFAAPGISDYLDVGGPDVASLGSPSPAGSGPSTPVESNEQATSRIDKGKESP